MSRIELAPPCMWVRGVWRVADDTSMRVRHAFACLCRGCGVLLLLLLLVLIPSSARSQALQPAAPNSDDEVVYIDPNGFIRVYDATGSPPIAWSSPEGGWSAAALGDFTGEGDDEIVAVGGNGASSRLIIYDPVVASGSVDANQHFNGVPWRTLYVTALTATPRLVAVGEFVPGVPGHEIIYTTDAPSEGGDPRSQITILAQTGGSVRGTSWAPYASLLTSQRWSDISTGDLEMNGVDNVVLIDEDRGVLAVHRLQGGNLVRYFTNASDTREWSSSAIGQVDPATDQLELVLVRQADRPLASLIVWRYEPLDEFVDVYLNDYAPSPREVFLADINANAESEIFMLRDVRRTAGCPAPYTSAPFQLFIRNRGPDRPPAFDVCLDQANTFRYGAGGDLNGDGKDEVIVLSATQLRIFSNLDATFSVSNVAVSSNARTLLTGNLDRAGSVKPNTLAASQSRLVFEVSAGSQSNTQTVMLTNSASPEAIPLRVRTRPYAPFVRWSLSSRTTPATLTVSIDAAELLPGIDYAADLLIESAGVSVSNAPLRIPVLADVKEGLVVRPAYKTLVISPCTAAPASLQLDLRVLGSPGMTFDAEVAPGLVAAASSAAQAAAPTQEQAAAVAWPVRDLPWISSAESLTTTVPATITLTINPSALGYINEAHVSVESMLGAEIVSRFANITVICTDDTIYAPFVPDDSWGD